MIPIKYKTEKEREEGRVGKRGGESGYIVHIRSLFC